MCRPADAGAPKTPLARVSQPSGSPRSAVMAANVICLIILRVLGATGLEVWQHLGTLGTLAILVGYGLVNVGATRAVFDRSLGVPQWRGLLPAIAVVLVGYVLYANVYPAPSFPYNLFPYILLATGERYGTGSRPFGMIRPLRPCLTRPGYDTSWPRSCHRGRK